MDTLSSQSFSNNVLLKEPIVIIHYVCLAVAFLCCYPIVLLTQRRQKLYFAVIILASIGFITGGFIQLNHSAITFLFQFLALLLLCLFYFQITLYIYRSKLLILPLDQFFYNLPKWLDLFIAWLVLFAASSYLILGTLVFTESCSQDTLMSQCLMPLAMGAGFLLYGSCILLHLLAIFKLPRLSTPEYYEAVILTFWGFISLLISNTPILGSEWKALNLGLLWFTGGLFSICSSIQKWLPMLREKNIVNSLTICLTGRAIVRGITQMNDPYISEVHSMLGYILIIGSICRIIQITFRKSPMDNLQSQQNADTLLANQDCKHQCIFASVTLVSGLLASFLAIGGGILLMGANVGWIRYMRFYIKDPSTYVNMTLAAAFLWSAYVFGLCTIYKNNTAHSFDYIELDNTKQDNWPYREDMIETLAVASPTTFDNFTAISPTLPEAELYMIPTKSNSLEQDLYYQSTSVIMDTTEKAIRPSEYRAKRRSLLTNNITINTQQQQRKRSSTVYGVGGILPDEINTPNMDSTFRRSWLSSSSSIDSSAPNSPPLLLDKPFASISSTLPHNHYFTSHNTRRNSETYDDKAKSSKRITDHEDIVSTSRHRSKK